jgi:2-oxoglutarate dehydrogenase E1 component
VSKWTYFQGANASYIDQIFEQYRKDPSSVEDTWRSFFEGMELGAEMADGGATRTNTNPLQSSDLNKEAKVTEVINYFRSRGRFLAKLDPLGMKPPQERFELKNFGLSEADLGETFTAGSIIGLGKATLRDIVERLKQTYARTLAVEYKHIQQAERVEWLQQHMESCANRETLSKEVRIKILRRLTESEVFENFLNSRFVAQKRFSIEGGEALIPALDRIINVSSASGANNVVMGMAHRGRLNVLANIFGKNYEYIFTEFEQNYELKYNRTEGDVKYHMGYSADIITESGGSMHLSLANNPSHLEFVNPVVEGIARAKQNEQNDVNRSKVIPILIHGDAAFAGQGVVFETLNFSQVAGYWTGGTIHIVIDNQIAFTATSNETRSTPYATDVAKMLAAPIFHVNGDDPEALFYASRLATEYRQNFKCDVFIDLICYRKYGHNESDEPAFTQPLMYKNIRGRKSVRELYAERLITEGVIQPEEAQAMVDELTQKMQHALDLTREEKPQPFISSYQNKNWKKFRSLDEVSDMFKEIDTKVKAETLIELSQKLNQTPEGFHLHPKLVRLFEGRAKAVEQGQGLDWGNVETLTFATLLKDGYGVRLSGQDAERGTFSHRHSVWNDVEYGNRYVPLQNLDEKFAKFLVINSTLSEAGVLGFEYGWSLATPMSLVIWEAQFGDFFNGAQVIIDQFISSGESKWRRASGLVMLLPHGYEGQGPEHSSARIERFLQSCANDNMSVCNFTTPANLFHALRRQMLRDFRRPLVVATPKSLLRHPLAVSSLEDLSEGSFQEVIDDHRGLEKTGRKILLCSGKIYYELLAKAEEKNLKNVVIIRIEQLYPWPEAKLAAVLAKYSKDSEVFWVQEEPRNMGAWTFVSSMWSGALDNFGEKHMNSKNIRYVGRDVGAAPAVGSYKKHTHEQETIVEKALS